MPSGTISLNQYGSDTHYKGRLKWTSTPNPANNTSYVTLTLQYYFEHPDTARKNFAAFDIYIDCGFGYRDDALKYVESISEKQYYYAQVWTTAKTMSFTVYHDSSGNRTMYVGGYVQRTNYTDLTNLTTGGRAPINLGSTTSLPSVTGAVNFNDEENPTMTYSNPMGDQVTSLEGCIASENGSIIYANYRSISKTGSSYTFNLTDAERASLRAAVAKDTLSVRFYVRSVIRGTTYHAYSAPKTMTLINAQPTLAPTVVDTNTTTVALTGNSSKFIRGHNAMKFAFNASAKKGASIKSYNLVCGAFKSASSSGTFNNVESGTFVFSITDSRGYTASKTIELTGIDYVQLTCNQKVQMAMQPDSSAQVHLTVTGDCFSGNFGAKKNDLRIYVRHSEDGGAWGAWGEITPLLESFSGNKYSLTADVSGFDVSGTYTFQCKAVDSLGEVVTAEYPVKFTPVFDWGKYDFNFNVPVTIEGNPLVDFVIETGTTSMGSNGTWYWAKWASGKAECYGCRNYGNMAVTTAWGGLYRSEAFTQSLPSGLFVSTPEFIDITYRHSNYGAWIAKHETSAPSSSSSGSFIVVRPASATLSQAYIGFNVVGRWK